MISSKTNLRILVVDDNPEIHKDFIKILTKYLSTPDNVDDLENKIFGEQNLKNEIKTVLPQFTIDIASQGQEGVTAVSNAIKELNPYSLAFVDIRMPPGWNGIETIKRIWQLDPDVQIVICTAYSDYSWENTVNELGHKENLLILKKPFDSIAVRQLACALTKKWQLMQDTRRNTLNLKQQVADRTASLRESLSLVRATLESSNDGILVINNEGNIIDYNQKFINLWAVPTSIIEERNGVRLYAHMKNQIEDPELFLNNVNIKKSLEIKTIKFKDGKTFEYYSQPQIVENKIVGQVFDFHDITHRAQLEKKLEYQATHDALTGLPNRVLLLDRIKQAIVSSEKNNSLFAILFLDLDRFKLINDSLSHAVGDEVLKIAANRLHSTIRKEDTLTRLGGDEFVIILTELAHEEHLIKKINAIQLAFNEPFFIEKRNIIVSVSIGISLYPTNGVTPDILLRNADSAMYIAKEKRGNSYQLYNEELSSQSITKLDQELQLRQALAKKEFFLCYQPQFDLKENKIVAVEALIRWQNPQQGLMLPIDFIQLAEETGLIVQIGEWVLREACIQNKRWQEAGLPSIRVAVNITAQQFTYQNIVLLIKNILQETNLDPKYLELELTENVIISNREIINAITELKELGLTIAIDDFGTGYSSLSYLKKIPLDRLKIDKTFIQQIQSSTDDEVIIRAVIAMAKNLNLEVLAEGVENQSQLNFLKQHDCGDAQGYLFSKPLTASEFEVFMRNLSSVDIIPM